MYYKVIIFIIFLILFTIVMWQNAYHHATLQIFGLKMENLPVLLVVLSSMLVGMLIMIPLMWMGKIKAAIKKRKEQKEKLQKEQAQPKKTTTVAKPADKGPAEK